MKHTEDRIAALGALNLLASKWKIMRKYRPSGRDPEIRRVPFPAYNITQYIGGTSLRLYIQLDNTHVHHPYGKTERE